MQKAKLASILLVLLAGLDAACRGKIPPTEPPRLSDEGSPSTRTNDGASLGPLTGDGILAAGGTGSGGTSILPTPPTPGPGGTHSGGTAGSGIRNRGCHGAWGALGAKMSLSFALALASRAATARH